MKRVQTMEQRFWKKVDKTDSCWQWTGSTNGKYGKIRCEDQGPLLYAHRYSYLLHYGDYDQSMQVCHHCDNPLCVRPDHLFLGTHADNMADRQAKGRQSRGSDRPAAKLSEHDVSMIKWALDAGVRGNKLAELFGVTPALISYIKVGKGWSHVPAMEYQPCH